MRTTLDIDTDILLAVKELSRQRRTTAGAVLSDLARRALTSERLGNEPPEGSSVQYGVPVFSARPNEVVTLEHVQALDDGGV